MDGIFLVISFIFLLFSWRTSFFWISLALFADFCAFIGFDSYMLSDQVVNLLGEENLYLIFVPLKGVLLMIFFLLYLNISIHLKKCTPSSAVAMHLAALAALAGISHFFAAYLQMTGSYITIMSYLMTVYCIVQLTVMAGGLIYGYVYRIDAHYPRWFNHLGHH